MRLGDLVAGRYRLINGPISGGMGEVWVAQDENLPRTVVLKRALLGKDDATAFKRLQDEARALVRFSHPHVVTLFDVVRVRTAWGRSTSWLVLEHVAGGSLEDWPAMSPQNAARIGAHIADALEALRDEGIVHCDIKPGNIVVTDTRTAKLADFGVAHRLHTRETGASDTPRGHTPGFAAPEVEQGRPQPASDVFSLGATLHALVTGEPPHGTAVAESADIGPLREIVDAMLQPDPAGRPAPGEIHRRLDAVAGTVPLNVPSNIKSTWEPPQDFRPSAWRRRTAPVRNHPRIALATAAVVAAGLVVLGVTWPSGPPASSKEGAQGGSLVGDPRTADPCSLIAPSALSRFGDDVVVDKHYGNFNRCDVVVSSGRDRVDVRVQLDDGTPETNGPSRAVGPIRVFDETPDDDRCARPMLLPAPDSRTTVVIVVDQEEGRHAPLCEMADAAATAAATALGRGPMARRVLPPNSLGNQDACGLLDADALNVVPGVNAAEPEVGFGRWECEWQSTTKHLAVRLRFDQSQPLTAADGRPTKLGGYRAFVVPRDEGDDTCVVRLAYRRFTERGNEGDEMVHLVVAGAEPVDRLCRTATDLTAAATRSLPRP